jgi:hypothetical protein
MLVGGVLLTAEEKQRLTTVFQLLELGDLTTTPLLDGGATALFPTELGTGAPPRSPPRRGPGAPPPPPPPYTHRHTHTHQIQTRACI